MKNIQSIYNIIDKNKKKHIQFIQRLVRESRKGEESIQILVTNRFRELGCEVDIIRAKP